MLVVTSAAESGPIDIHPEQWLYGPAGRTAAAAEPSRGQHGLNIGSAVSAQTGGRTPPFPPAHSFLQRTGLRQIGGDPAKWLQSPPVNRLCGRIGRHEEKFVGFLLTVSRAIDALNRHVGHAVYWLILAMVLVSAGNAMSRYLFDISSNAWLELQWYLFSAVFLLAAGYALLHNEHVRIDVIFGHLPPRARAWIDVLGGVFFLLPMAIIIMALAWPVFVASYQGNEYSSDAGGLLRWPVKLLIPVGFLLLALQGISEIVKRIAFLLGHIPDPLEKHRDPVAEEQLPKAPLGGALS